MYGLLFASLAAAAVPQVPLDHLMRWPAYEEVRISPRGEYLAATVPDGDQTGVVILDLRDLSDVKVSAGFRVSRHETATGLQWASDDRLVFTSIRQEGPLAQRHFTGNLYAINADGSRGGQIYGARGGSSHRWATVIHALPDDPNFILIATQLGENDPAIAQRLHIFGQDRGSQVAVSPLRRGSLAADQQGRVRFAYGMTADGRQQLAWRPDEGTEWRTFSHTLGSDISGAAFSADGRYVYLMSRNTADLGVFRVDLEAGTTEKLLGDPTFEPTNLIWDRTSTEVIGAGFATPVPEARWFDPRHPDAALFRGLEAAFPGYVASISSATRDGRLVIMRVMSDREPGVFYAVDTENLHVAELVAAKPWLDPDLLGSKRPVSFTARDGLVLHGYLTVPPGVEDPRRMPLIVEIHGGPHGPYDRWTYDAWTQMLATHGYAVLQINFRGSGGRGAQFERGAYRMWGAQMQDDITDGTRWAIERGIADPTRICLSGASYGGFSTLSGLVREPDLYACGFAFVGVYDLELMHRIGNIPRSDFGRRYLEQALGRDRDELRARSPIHHVSRIKAPLYVVHGGEDHQAHFGQYHALVRALEAARIPHEKLLVPHEGHGFYRVENRVKLAETALDFFDRHIGARRGD